MWRRKESSAVQQTWEKTQVSVEGSLTQASLEVKDTYTAFLPAEYGAATVENATRWIK